MVNYKNKKFKIKQYTKRQYVRAMTISKNLATIKKDTN